MSEASLLPIIVIDDDREDLELMCDTLKKAGNLHPVLCFDKSYDALDLLNLEGTMAHFIVCDVHMPRLDGYTLRESMLSRTAPINDQPFFIVSSVITAREIAALPDLRIDRFYIKAFTQEEMLFNCADMLRHAVK